MKRIIAYVFIIALVAPSLLMVESVSAQTTSKPATPEFTVTLVEKVIDVEPTYTTEPYSGETITQTNGYHGSYWVVGIKIKNAAPDLFYNYRIKGHFGAVWAVCPLIEHGDGVWTTREYSPFDLTIHPTYARSTSSEYTEVQVEMHGLKVGDQVDVEVQAISGTIANAPNGGYQVLTGQGSEWSSTQTITVGEDESPSDSTMPPAPTPDPTLTATPSTSPTVIPIQPDLQANVFDNIGWEVVVLLAGLVAAVAVLAVGLVVLWRKVADKKSA